MFSLKYNDNLDNVLRYQIKSPDIGRRLHMSERTVPFPEEKFQSFIASLSQEDFIQYHSTSELKEKLAVKHGVLPENIAIGPGSEFILSIIFQAFVSKQSKVLVPSMHFPMYDVYINQNGGIKCHMEYSPELKLSTAEINKSEYSLIIIGNPNSPLGDIVPKDEIERLSGHCPLVLDQAYGEFGKTDVPIDRISKGIIFVNTLSKAYGAAGCRVGYCIAHSDIITILDKLRLMFEVSSISQKFALFLLDNEEMLETYRTEITHEREILKANISSAIINYGNWIHLPENEFKWLSETNWIYKTGIQIPHHINTFARITIFPGMYDQLQR